MRQTILTSALLLSLAACADKEPEQTPPPGGASSMTPPQCDNPQELCLLAPEHGFQIQSVGTTIEPGEDVEYCEVVTLPGTTDDTYYVKAFESQMTQGSHHLIVAAIEPGTDTDAAATPGDRVPCMGADVFGGELLPVTGVQHPYNLSEFPEGVGRVYAGGQKLVFDYHYFNTTPEPIAAKAAVNFHLADESDVEKLARTFGFYNIGINIPPGSSASFTEECRMSHDLMVYELVRHTHHWGAAFNVWYAGGEHDGEQIFSSQDYEHTNFPFEEPVLVKAGEGFRFECAYDNTEDRALHFGLKATDEMCILFGNWFVVNANDEVADQDCLLLGE